MWVRKAPDIELILREEKIGIYKGSEGQRVSNPVDACERALVQSLRGKMADFLPSSGGDDTRAGEESHGTHDIGAQVQSGSSRKGGCCVSPPFALGIKDKQPCCFGHCAAPCPEASKLQQQSDK